jgi:glycosyltransferase involved in cell wall biosynthesis
LKALAKLKNLKIKTIFIGSGPDLASCKEYVLKNNLKNVTFSTEVDHHELNSFYNSIDLFVLPSYYEALGCVYMEAMQVGKPIVAVKKQGIEELIDSNDKKYFLMEKGNVEQLMDLIRYHYENINKKYDYDFSIENYISTFLDYIKKL